MRRIYTSVRFTANYCDYGEHKINVGTQQHINFDNNELFIKMYQVLS